MSQSKSQFMELRAQHMEVMYDHEFTKTKAIQTGKDLVEKVFDEGEADPYKVFSNIARLKAVLDSASEAFRERLAISSKTSWNGVTFTPKNGAERLQYEEDDVCANLMKQLEDRKALVKTATKSNDVIYDKEGCEVPKVSSKFDKSSITVTF